MTANDEITQAIDNDHYGPWPDRGTPVACQHLDEHFVGTVKCVWLAMDVVVITVMVDKDHHRNLIREFGDKCVPVKELFQYARAGKMLHPGGQEE